MELSLWLPPFAIKTFFQSIGDPNTYILKFFIV